MISEAVTAATCQFINTELTGRRVMRAWVVDTRCPVQQINIEFADGAVVALTSEHDESFHMRLVGHVG